jgi:hypothetical protein
VSQDLNTATLRRSGASARRWWLAVALGVAALLVATAVLLPFGLRAAAVRDLRAAGFVILTEKSPLPEWARPLAGDLFDRPFSVMTHEVSVRPHLWSLRHIGPLEDMVLKVEPGVTDVLELQPELRGLGLVEGEVTPEIMDAIIGLHDLENVAIEDCRINAETLRGLSRLPRLKHLSLAGTPLDADCLKALDGLLSLEVLALERTGAPESEVQKLQDALPRVQITDD